VPTPNLEPTLRIGHLYLDVRRRLLQCLNPAARQLHNEGVPFTPSDPGCKRLLSPEGKPVPPTDLPLVRAYREGKPVEAQFLLARDGGVPWRVAWSVTPFRGANGQIISLVGSVAFGTPEPDWQVMAELAHDLGTPLNALKLLCSLLDKQPDGEKRQKTLEGIRTSTDRALRIGLELLERCRGPVRVGPPADSWLALEAFLVGLAQEQGPAAERKGLVLTTDFAAAAGWEVRIDRGRLGRVLSNLLVNAVRYTSQGRVDFRASWREERGQRQLALSVIDTGVGISQEERDSIFQPFERGRAGRETDSGGSGLGLAVVDRLVEELGLALDVYSQHGRGSTFHLLIPADRLRPAPDQPAPPTSAATASPADTLPG
jgi:two-component sensor histidine kinase